MARLLALAVSAVVGLSAGARDLNTRYAKENLLVGGVSVTAYVADTDQLRAEGLMHVTHLPENTGMLFVFSSQQSLSFWMKNTLIPLSIGFFDDKGILVDVQEMDPPRSVMDLKVPQYRSRKLATFALEMNKGWFARNKIKEGAKLSLAAPAKSALLNAKLKASKPSRH